MMFALQSYLCGDGGGGERASFFSRRVDDSYHVFGTPSRPEPIQLVWSISKYALFFFCWTLNEIVKSDRIGYKRTHHAAHECHTQHKKKISQAAAKAKPNGSQFAHFLSTKITHEHATIEFVGRFSALILTLLQPEFHHRPEPGNHPFIFVHFRNYFPNCCESRRRT